MEFTIDRSTFKAKFFGFAEIIVIYPILAIITLIALIVRVS